MMIGWVGFVLAWTGAISAWVLSRRRGDARGPRYFATLFLEHLAFALQGVAVLACLARISALLTAFAAASWCIWFCADALVYGYAGLRMQWNLLAAIGELPTLGARFAWRRALVGLFAVTLFCGVLGWRMAQPSAWIDWLSIGLAALAGVVVAVMTEPFRRELSLSATFDWNIRLIAREAAALTRLFGTLRVMPATDGALQTTDADAAAHDPARVPRTLVPHHEVATSPDPTRPLMRLSAGFSGATHFDLRIDAGEKPHVVMVFLESVRAADVGVLGAKHGPRSVTPCFDALAAEGVLWRDFYAGGTITALAMNSALYGVPPPFIQRTYTESSPEATLLGMPHIFADQGYLPAFFCDGPLDWENKRQFLLHNGFRLFYAAPSIKTRFPEAPEVVWHFPDEYLMRFHAEWLAQQDARGTPTFSSLLTVTNHYPWTPPKDAPTIDVPLDPESMQYRYLRCTAYTDRCLGQYMDAMRERGLDKKTVFLIMGDHAQQVNDANDVWWSGRATTDGMRVPCLLYAPGRVQPRVIDEVASQADLLPTLLDTFGIQAAHHAVGTSLRRQCDERTAITVQPWVPGMAATRFDAFRHAYNFETGRSGLYDAASDPNSLQDVAAQHPEIARDRHLEAQQMRAFFGTLYAEDRIATAPGTAYLEGRLLLNAPEHFPRTIEACRERLRTLQTMRDKRTREDAKETTLLMLALNTQGLDDEERLAFAQLLLARVHIARVGELTDAEEARLAALEARATYPEAMPSWERDMIDSIRHLAHDKPYPFYRTAKPGQF